MEYLYINQREIPFQLRRNKRAKHLILKLDPRERKVILTVPRLTMGFQINRFLREKADWIEAQWLHFENQKAKLPTLDHTLPYYKNRARVQIRERLKYFKALYQVEYNRVFFKDQKTRWGSCSAQGNLNFNWRLILAPPEILDYVVVHELCHLIEMNHSKQFWALVAQQVPDHKLKRKWLKENHYWLASY